MTWLLAFQTELQIEVNMPQLQNYFMLWELKLYITNNVAVHHSLNIQVKHGYSDSHVLPGVTLKTGAVSYSFISAG
jgi:hypothetical protein